MIEKPEYVKNFVKKKNEEIKCISGNWYLYERTPYYDKVKKQTRRKSAKIIGKITPDGLVPSKHRTPKNAAKGAPKDAVDAVSGDTEQSSKDAGFGGVDNSQEPTAAEPQEALGEELAGSDANGHSHVRPDGTHTRDMSDAGTGHTVDTGSVGYLLSLTERMRDGLRIAFPDCWVVIYVIAMLRAIHGRGGRFSKIEEQYKSSFLSVLWPDLELGKDALTGFLAAVGLDRDAMIKYMNYMRDEDEQIAILDGHKIICSSKNIKTAVLGHDTKKRYKCQINVLYFFSKSEGTIGLPTYYEQFPGSTNDMNALEDIVQESGIPLEDITAVADKGCTSGTLMETFENGSTKYVFGIKRGTYGLSEKTPSFDGYDGTFSYHGRGIKHYTYECDDHKSKVVVFLDLYLLAHEGSSRIVRCELSGGKIVKQVQKDLNQRQKKLEKAKTTLKHAEETVAKADGRVKTSEADLGVAKGKRDEALAEVSAKQISLKGKQDKLAAATAPSKKEQAKGVVSRAEVALEKARAHLNTTEAVVVSKSLQLAKEQNKLTDARLELAAAQASVKQCQEAVDVAKNMLARAKAFSDDISNVLAEDASNEVDCSLPDPVTREVGTFAVKTNRMDLSAEDIYRIYKQRPAIEEYFKVYDDTLGFDSSYMQSASSLEAWLFFNHLSATMAVLALQKIADSGQSKNVSFNGLMDLLSAVRSAATDDGWRTQTVGSKIAGICERLGYDPWSIPCI